MERANRIRDGIATRLTIWTVLSIVHFAATFGAVIGCVLSGMRGDGNHQFFESLIRFLVFPANLLPPALSTWVGEHLGPTAFVAVNSAAATLALMLGIEAVYRGGRGIASALRSRRVGRGFEIIRR